MPKDKTLKVGARAEVKTDGNRLEVTSGPGLVFVTVTDLAGNVVYAYHPLSGWYIEMDMRKESDDRRQD